MKTNFQIQQAVNEASSVSDPLRPHDPVTITQDMFTTLLEAAERYLEGVNDDEPSR